ncbi:Undecaprenyl-phosphate N-acetylglucosaminyl 1-phosphate transferase [Candidatus Nitrospira nitrosa]|uniref:Undecaprenyl-phosphate N-acetylglucosaminyl 1-phosphate transferase n=1 Tax=Candidatus Nitrospira nitrosa TaxID=1742972 RepID=A0A0S4LEK8_9BACT|nr:glycosyltransferase family 4 protein [Candidatus Nitrospira nitrosa]CUS35146.1 Undecaprenyl-phosphate N-acetylglucosaminyl 1-phosphate transferase [Candidatus Nitrospira nitrosa]
MMLMAFPALVAFVVAWWITKRLCSPKSFLSILAHPNERTLHAMPTPQTGGLAVIGSVVIGLILVASLLAITQPSKSVLPKGVASGSLWIILSMLLVFVVSFIDDCIGLPATLRLSVQVAAACIVIAGVGLTVSAIPIPGGPTIQLGLAAVPVSALLLVWMANLYNFMDGMDGFAGGMTFWGFGFLAYLGWQAQFPVMLIISTFVAMGALGFLMHNFPPARIFMGDAGSITVGFLAGTLMILGVRDRLFEIWVPIMIFSPFIVDATVTLVKRVLHGKRVWEAHREHYYQRVVLSGWSHRRTVLAEYGVMILCGGLAVSYHHSTDNVRVIILGVWAGMFVLLAMLVHMLELKMATSCPVQDSQVAGSKKKVQAMPAEDSSRVTVNT